MAMKRKAEWRRVIEALVRAGAPHDMVKRFEVLTRPFFRNAERGFWPLYESWRCEAFFAAAAVSKLFGVSVDRIRFVGMDERIFDRIDRDFDYRLLRLPDKLEGLNLRALDSRLMDITTRVRAAIEANCPGGDEAGGKQVLPLLALTAASGDRELFDALGSVAIAMRDMIPLGPDREDPTLWYFRAGHAAGELSACPSQRVR